MRLGIEHISVFGLPPVEFVNLAADLGCEHISTGLTGIPYNPHGYPPFSLRDDPALRREMLAAMHDRGVSISLGEGLTIRPGVSAIDFGRDLEIMRELGIARINTVSMDPCLERSFDQFGVLSEMATALGMVTTTEFAPSLTVCDLATALAAVRHVGHADFRLLIDTMHLVRSGATAADIAGIDPVLIDYIQLSDAPREPRFDNYSEESMFERMCPGSGGLGLRDIVAALPKDRVYGLEVPLRREAEAGIGPHERLGKCVEAARQLLAETHRKEPG